MVYNRPRSCCPLVVLWRRSLTWWLCTHRSLVLDGRLIVALIPVVVTRHHVDTLVRKVGHCDKNAFSHRTRATTSRFPWHEPPLVWRPCARDARGRAQDLRRGGRLWPMTAFRPGQTSISLVRLDERSSDSCASWLVELCGLTFAASTGLKKESVLSSFSSFI